MTLMVTALPSSQIPPSTVTSSFGVAGCAPLTSIVRRLTWSLLNKSFRSRISMEFLQTPAAFEKSACCTTYSSLTPVRSTPNVPGPQARSHVLTVRPCPDVKSSSVYPALGDSEVAEPVFLEHAEPTSTAIEIVWPTSNADN